MIAELGHFALILACLLAFLQAGFAFWGTARNQMALANLSSQMAILQFLMLGISFIALTWLFVVSDFSVQLVAANSHSDKPMLYKISGVWGNHEGSMLLWLLILSLYGALVAVFGDNLPNRLRALVLGVQASLGVSLIAFVLLTSNPFLRLINPPFNGNDLNPLLQDPGLAFHPPFLYLGYVGLSMTFSFAVAGLMEGRIDAAWARWVRPWTLLAWITLTIGIGLGSWWAYYELGWGGFWFWDPVENASFVPWLFATALLHSAIVVEKRQTLKSWTILLAILAFSFSLIGTFIVRSGMITSVHAFANDPERGVFILAILAFFTGGALMLYTARAQQMGSNTVFALQSRESGLVINNMLLSIAGVVVFVGTIWPLMLELVTGDKISVGAQFFNISFTPFMVALAIVLPVFAILPWKRGNLKKAFKDMVPAFIIAILIGLYVAMMKVDWGFTAFIGAGLGVWLVLGSLIDLLKRARFGHLRLSNAVSRLFTLPRAEWAKAIAHMGLGITFLGIALITAGSLEDVRAISVKDSFAFGGYEISFDAVGTIEGPNYDANRAQFTVYKEGKEIARLYPEKRLYRVQAMPTTEAGIYRNFWKDIYVVIGDKQPDGRWAVRSYIKPFANWIWAGVLLMAFGGLLSMSDRRFRVGAPQRNTKLKEAS